MPLSSERKKYIMDLLIRSLPEFIAADRKEKLKNAQYCRLCILDAFAGRLSSGLASNMKKGKVMFTIFSVQTSELMLNSIIFFSMIHSMSIFIEPVNGAETSVPIRLLHVFSILLYIVDIILKIAYQGWDDYFSSDWQRLYALSAGLNTIDLIFHGGRTAWCNFLRPVAGLLRSREGRRFFEAVQKMVPIVGVSLVPLTLFILAVSIFGAVTFGESLGEFKGFDDHHYNWFWLILTNDTLGNLMPEGMFSNTMYTLFFFPMIYVGQKFLLSLILGATFDTFKSMTESQLKKEKVKELQGLVKGFTSIDDRKIGVINVDMWDMVMHELGYTPEEAALYYEIISEGSNELTVYQFLSLKNTLDYKFRMVGEHAPADPLAKSLSSLIPKEYEYLLPQTSCKMALGNLHKMNFNADRYRVVVAVIDILLLLFGAHGSGLIPFVSSSFFSVYTVIGLLFLPIVLPVLLEFGQKAKDMRFTIDSLEILIDMNPFLIIYIAIFFKMLIDIYLGIAYMDILSMIHIPAAVLVALLNTGDLFLRLIENSGNLATTILNDVDSSDYIGMSTCFCTFADLVFPLFHIANPLLFPELASVANIIRGVSCLRIFRYKDTNELMSLGRVKLAELQISVPVQVSDALKKTYDYIKNVIDPPKKEEVKSEKKDKEKKEKKDKKEKKKTEKVPVDVTALLRQCLVALDIILLVLDLHNVSVIPFLPIKVFTPCHIISVLYLVEFASQLMQVDGNLGALLPITIDSSTVYILGVIYLIFAALLQISGLGLLPVISTLVGPNLMIIFRLVRAMRVINENKDLATFLDAIPGVTSLFIQQMMFAFVTVYMFAMLGNLLFGRFSEKWVNPLAAMVTSQHLFLPADFVDTVEDTMEKTSVLAIFFFILFFFVSLVVCNIALSIVIEWYGDALNEDGKTAAVKEKKATEQLFQAAKSRANTRSILRSVGLSRDGARCHLYLDGITCYRESKSDMRSKLVGPLSLEHKDLADCQKYASIDLIKGFDEFKKAQESKDEAAFIDSFSEAEVGAMEDFSDEDVLFSAGETATKGYLLVSGSVRIQHSAGRWYNVQPLAFLGSAVLQPNGVHTMNCKANGDVKCLVISQEDVVAQLSDELSGSLTRLAFKTMAMLAKTVEDEAKRKAARRRRAGIPEAAVEDVPVSRVPILISDDNDEFRSDVSQVLNNLGCITKPVDYSAVDLESHLMATKLSAVVSDLHRVDKSDKQSVFVTAKMIVRIPRQESVVEDFSNYASKKILIVDDVSLVRKMISKVVNKIGFETDTTENGRVACDKFAEDPTKYVAIILDLHMPVMDGIETLKIIRGNMKSTVPIFILTGDADNASVTEQVIDLGANLILHKPVDAAEVTRAFVSVGIINVSP